MSNHTFKITIKDSVDSANSDISYKIGHHAETEAELEAEKNRILTMYTDFHTDKHVTIETLGE